MGQIVTLFAILAGIAPADTKPGPAAEPPDAAVAQDAAKATEPVGAKAVGPALAKTPEARLAAARRYGWKVAEYVVKNLESSDERRFPGLRAFARDYREATKALDTSAEAGSWPAIDLDALVTRNPNFLRAQYEVRPGDPGWMSLHVGILLGAGEVTRARQFLLLARQRKGVPRWMRDAFDALETLCDAVLEDADLAAESGVQAAEAKEDDEAIRRFEAALATWPNNARAHYELAQVLRLRALAEKDRKAKAARIETIEAHLARARRHDPMLVQAYQGPSRAMLDHMLALRMSQPCWGQLDSGEHTFVADSLLLQFSEACSRAGIDDLALAARQVVISRRGFVDLADLGFIEGSIEALAPGPLALEVSKFLNRKYIVTRVLVPTEPEPKPERPILSTKREEVRSPTADRAIEQADAETKATPR
ncbi:MAG TPA: hypothetical protein VG406_19000 [Isosphaeraceae bacterium]|jgi:tetratricopeptide (TPR) repeat protein|nr:hypothetical protein [Isosphaeraceae bacterium]